MERTTGDSLSGSNVSVILMKSNIKKARKALQGIHQDYLMYAMSQKDSEYIEAMNGIFRLLDRLEKEEESQ